jgi:molecular chaperone DnaK (HSP70)
MVLPPEGEELRLPGKSLRVLGVDLGTTISTAAEIAWHSHHGAPTPARCLEVEQATGKAPPSIHVLVPSVVAIHGGLVVVGEGKKRRSVSGKMGRAEASLLIKVLPVLIRRVIPR